jgi:hypothetical protein
MKSPLVSWLKSKNRIFLWAIKEKTGRIKILLSKLRNFSLFSFQFSFSLVWREMLIFILTPTKIDSKQQLIHACNFIWIRFQVYWTSVVFRVCWMSDYGFYSNLHDFYEDKWLDFLWDDWLRCILWRNFWGLIFLELNGSESSLDF